MAYIFTDSQIHERSLIKGLYSILFFLLFQIGFSQTEIDKKAIKLVEKSDEAVADRDFQKARDLLNEALKRDSSYAKTYERLFTVLRILQKRDQIHQLQLRYVKNVNERFLNNQIWQSLASYEFSKGNYDEASKFMAEVQKKDSVLYESIQFSLEQISEPKEFEVTLLPPQINKLTFQYLPVLTIDGRTMIFTGLPGNGSDEDIYTSQFEGGDWSEATPISDTINTPYNEGACSISADGRTLIFTACEGRPTFGNCDLYLTQKTGDTWSTPKNLGEAVNSRHWDSQPSLSADGKTLYFVSNRPGGIGGRDIWITQFDGDKWSTPRNPGRPINTRHDETTPFIYANNRTLFFSSNGHVGLGGFDLFKAEFENGKWVKIKNLGFPINTFNDEVSLFITSSGDQAFFTKEESRNGKTYKSEIASYLIPKEKPFVPSVSYITGKVKDATTGQPLDAKIELVDLTNRGKTYSTESDPSTGKYFLVLPSSLDFGMFVERSGYLPQDISLSTSHLESSDTVDFQLQPIIEGAKMILSNIYFEFDSDELNDRSLEELSRIAEFLKREEHIHVEISGHTDNVGKASYNQGLSERRAKAVYMHLTTLKVSPSRMKHTGFGSSQPIATNETTSGQDQNRRIEFKITSLKN